MSIEIYDEAYLKRFEERAHTELGKQIYAARWRMIERHAKGELTLLDYGCAGGAFHESATNGFKATGWDVNPFSKYNRNMDWGNCYFDIVTMWDVIEHLHDPCEVLRSLMPDWLFLSTPNLESVRGDIRQWRHYRPGEHLYYFDQHSLKEILGSVGYKIAEINFEEGALRDPANPEAIISVAAYCVDKKP